MATLDDLVIGLGKKIDALTVAVNASGTPAILAAETSILGVVNQILAQVLPTPSPLIPSVTAISPNTGPAAGGTVVTITGVNLTGATGAQFGLVAGTAFSVTNDTTAVVTTPAQPAGVVDLVIVDAAGNSAISPADVFTYV